METWDIDRFRRETGRVAPAKVHYDRKPFTGAILIEYPLPPRILHPNGRTRNYGYRAAMIRKTRANAALIARGFVRTGLPWKKCTIHPTFYLKRKQDGDNLNAWIKPLIDSLQDAGIVANDSGVTLLAPTQITGAKETPRVVLRITEVAKGASE